MSTKNVIALVILVVAVTAVSTVLLMNAVNDDQGSDPEAGGGGYVEVKHEYNLKTYSPTDGKEYSLQFNSDKDGFVRVSFGQGIIGDYPYHKGDNYIHFDQVQRGGSVTFKFFDKA